MAREVERALKEKLLQARLEAENKALKEQIAQQGYTLLAFRCVVVGLLPHLPEMEMMRDIGLASYGALMLWVAGLVLMRRQRGVVVGLSGSPLGLPEGVSSDR